MKLAAKCLLFFCIPLFFSACAPATKITNTWSPPGLQVLPIKKVLVIAATNKAGKRDLFENAFVKEFEKHGVQAVAGAAILPKDDAITRERVLSTIQGAGIDAVFMMELKDVKEEAVYVPPRFDPVPNGYMAHMVHTPVTTTTPGYFATLVTVRIESTLYEARDGNPVWEAISETEDPVSAEKMLPGYQKAVMEALREKGFIH